MHLPADAHLKRGSELLALLAQWADDRAGWHARAAQHSDDIGRTGAAAAHRAEAAIYSAFFGMARQLQLSGEAHVLKNEALRKEGKRVWRDTDEAVDAAVAAARTALIPAPPRESVNPETAA